MICNECQVDKTGPNLEGLPVAEVMRVCREWKCAKCSRTPEQVDADFAAESAKQHHKPAHDWAALGARTTS